MCGCCFRISIIVLFSVCQFSVSWSGLVGGFWSVLFVWIPHTNCRKDVPSLPFSATFYLFGFHTPIVLFYLFGGIPHTNCFLYFFQPSLGFRYPRCVCAVFEYLLLQFSVSWSGLVGVFWSVLLVWRDSTHQLFFVFLPTKFIWYPSMFPSESPIFHYFSISSIFGAGYYSMSFGSLVIFRVCVLIQHLSSFQICFVILNDGLFWVYCGRSVSSLVKLLYLCWFCASLYCYFFSTCGSRKSHYLILFAYFYWLAVAANRFQVSFLFPTCGCRKSINLPTCDERWGAGVEYHFQEI